MKNLYKIENELYIVDNTEEINKDTKTCWCIDISCNELVLHQGVLPSYHYKHYKKIIMTTDKSINVLCSCGKDCGAKESGVQAIDDEFLEWFVKNPSCMEVEIEKGYRGYNLVNYKIIIPKEEPKNVYKMALAVNNVTMSCTNKPKKTLEEEAKELYPINNTGRMFMPNRDELNNSYKQEAFIEGAKWQQQRLFNKQQMIQAMLFAFDTFHESLSLTEMELRANEYIGRLKQ